MMEMQQARGGIDAVVSYLDDAAVPYEVVDHEQTFTAGAEARAAGVEPDHAAKTVVLREGDQYRLAVVPASHRLDVHKLRELLDASRRLRLATEQEMEDDLGDFELGAVPPLGLMVPAPEIIDSRLLEHDRILCTGGDHRHSVLMDPNDLIRLTDASVGDVCED
jgi:Ala-tRNA(Pro) deacylase